MRTTGSRFVTAVALALVVAVSLPALAAGSAVTVGELELISLGTPHPYPQGTGPDAREWTVQYPGATYIRLHFNRFDLAPGDAVTVSSPDGRQSFTYTGRGPHGSGEFWAFTVFGDTAVLRLQASAGGGDGFEVDSFGRGIVDLDGPGGPIGGDPGTESVCGTQDWKDVACYQGGVYGTEYERSRGAVLALIGCCSSCTAFKVSDSGQFLTNNHCTSSQSGVQSTELRLDYTLSGCGNGSAGYTGAVMGSSLIRTDYTLDYTLMTTTGASSSIPCLELENRLAPVGERLYIAGHPNGGVKKLSIESTSNAGGLCRVDASPYAGRDATSDIGYYCDTIGGSSGSPVLSGDTHKVIGIHHYGGCLNSGVRMDRILGQIGGVLDACAGGGGEVCGNGLCGAGETSCSCAADCGPAPTIETSCTDGLDNDCDGPVDCADNSCSLDPACPSCKPSGSICTAGSQCCSGFCKPKGKSGKRTCS